MSHEMKRKQEREFLDQVRKLEEIEQSREKLGKEAINSEFVFYNSKMRQEKATRRQQVVEADRASEYNYFPFVSGDLIEKHRATLGLQLKNDLQSYLQYKNTQSTRKEAIMSLFQDKYQTGRNTEGVSSKSNWSKQSPGIKQLFDSEYVRPDEN